MGWTLPSMPCLCQMGLLLVRQNGPDGCRDVGWSGEGGLGRLGVRHGSAQLAADVFGGVKLGGIEVLHRHIRRGVSDDLLDVRERNASLDGKDNESGA